MDTKRLNLRTLSRPWVLINFVVALLGLQGIQAQITVGIYGDLTPNAPDFEIYISFSDTVTGFEISDVNVQNGTIQSLTGKGRHYTALIKTQVPGNVTVEVASGAATKKGGSATNSASKKFIAKAEFNPKQVVWAVDSDEEWKAAGSQASGLNFKGGEAKPSGKTADYSSVLKTFPHKVKPEKVRLTQSPVWENWTTAKGNIGPSGASNAPIFLPIGDKDYYYFAHMKDWTYGAWHSKDMVNWEKLDIIVHPDSVPKVTDPNKHWQIGRWCTSAEYKEGMFYFLCDWPNDEEPHLFWDDNLKDNKPPSYSQKPIFNDPSHGSDASLFRDDADGMFHIIYEDWDPINPVENAYDSPLAGHTSSLELLDNTFSHHEHLPPVDHRTTPTGKYGTYIHPGTKDENGRWLDIPYEIHEPAQDAFGDWNTLKVGSQYYLFSDYDHHKGGEMSAAIHTSSSLYSEFKLVGELGEGHPDPTSGFAEGQFYLLTQKQDHTSPGPWVEKVEARAGVDSDGNGSIDQWTPWKEVEESYDHKPGYARVVDVTPAEIDISSLPEGLGFKFEFRVSDQTSNKSTPIMDRVEMSFLDPNATNIKSHQGQSNSFHFDGTQSVLRYQIDFPGKVEFRVYDLKGTLLEQFTHQHSTPGSYNLPLQEAHGMRVLKFAFPDENQGTVILHPNFK